ncbi:hypothetical protein FB451DRAFT_1498269 [Mycena latifolia]|nr:hypothetical protein FB451DRAFT_1498269 [Mycena latifolia]
MHPAPYILKAPSRRIGPRTLSLLPTEVYLEIFAYLEPSEEANVADCKRIFSSLALVCRFFCAHSIARIYRSLEFSGRDASSGSPGFCRLLLKGANALGQPRGSYFSFARHVAQSVKECTFRDWIGIPSASTFLKNYCKALGQMPNIESVRLESTPITLPLIQAITRFKPTSTTSCVRTSLTTLCIRSCTLDALIPEKDLVDLASLTLTDVAYFTTSSIPPSRIRVRQLEIFRTDSWTFADYFIKRKHPDLQVLELHFVEDVPALFAFLAKCPSIKELAIESIFPQSRDPIPSLTAPGLPHLHTIKILPSLLRYFSKRPLRKISLTGSEMRFGDDSVPHYPTLPLLTMQDALPLMQSTALVTELHVHQHIYFLFPFHKHFKDLEVLVLAYHHPNFTTIPAIFSAGLFQTAIQSVCTRWPGFPPLREFQMDFGETEAADSRHFMWDLQFQLELISSPLCTTFPQLTSIAFTRFIKWQRWDEHAEWRAFVPHRFRSFVRDKLARGTPFTDVGGCLDALDFKY